MNVPEPLRAFLTPKRKAQAIKLRLGSNLRTDITLVAVICVTDGSDKLDRSVIAVFATAGGGSCGGQGSASTGCLLPISNALQVVTYFTPSTAVSAHEGNVLRSEREAPIELLVLPENSEKLSFSDVVRAADPSAR